MRIALYLRVDTEDQIGATEHMIGVFKSYAKSKGDEVTAVYIDVSSTADRDRPQLNRMLADSANNIFDIVLAKSRPKLAKSVMHMIEIHNILKNNKVGYMFVNGLDPQKQTEGIYDFCNR